MALFIEPEASMGPVAWRDTD